MQTSVTLNNAGTAVGDCFNVYYPRLRVNKLGEIVLATSRSENGLTTGILVGKTPNSKSDVPIGFKCCDWEVVGELEDYDGEMTITFRNQVANSKR